MFEKLDVNVYKLYIKNRNIYNNNNNNNNKWERQVLRP